MDEQYITSTAAQQRLHRSARQIRKYVASGRLRSRRAGSKVLYHAGDIDRLAGELAADLEEPDQQALVPSGPLLDRIMELERQLGYLRGLLEGTTKERDEARRLLTDSQSKGRRPW